jgi:hypothetical protein
VMFKVNLRNGPTDLRLRLLSFEVSRLEGEVLSTPSSLVSS